MNWTSGSSLSFSWRGYTAGGAIGGHILSGYCFKCGYTSKGTYVR